MWKKAAPIGAALIAAWIGLNMFTNSDEPETAPDSTTSEISEDAKSTDEAAGSTQTAEVATGEATGAASETAEATTEEASATETAEAATQEADGDAAETAEATTEESDTSTAAVATAAVAATAAAVTAQAGEDAATGDAANTTAAETAGDSESVATTEMRYPIDPVTGATIFDQGKIEVTIEPTPVIEVEESEAAIEEVVAEVAEPAEAPVEEEPVAMVTVTQMRYPTDPATGMTLFDQGKVEVSFDVPADEAAAMASAAEASDAAAATDTQAVASTESGAATSGAVATSESADAGASGRLPVDPVTGATIYSAAQSASGGASTSTSISTSSTTTTMTRTIRSVDIGGIGRTIGSVFGTTTAVLLRSNDEATAKQALPALETASESLGALAEQFESLPEAAISPLSAVVKKRMALLMPLADTTLTRAGVAPVLAPVLEPMMEQLGSLGQ